MSKKHRPKRSREQRVSTSKQPTLPPLVRGHVCVIIVLTTIGFSVSAYLTYVHFHLHADPGWRSACDISTRLSCDAVVLSPFGSVLGKPLSLFAAWFYVVIAVVSVSALRRPRWSFPRSPPVVLFIGGAIAAALSVILAIVSIVFIGSLCPFCAALYAINIGLLAAAWHALRRTGEGVAQAMRLEGAYWSRKRGTAVGASVVALCALGLGMTAYSGSAGASRICDVVAKAAASGRALELVVYSDFQCPHCRALDRSLRSIVRDAGGALRSVAGHYPLDSECNPNVEHSRHPGACRQALAAICAGAQDRYADYSERLFEGAESGPDALRALAASLGLDRSRFDACLVSEKAARSLRESIAEAAARGVRATPTMFLNGMRQVGQLGDADLRCLARAASWPAKPFAEQSAREGP